MPRSFSAAELSIGRRIAGATRADVRRALWEDRTLVKTFSPRGTVHLLPTADLPMWTGALSALPSWYTNPRRWLLGFRPDDGDAALRTLLERYLYRDAAALRTLAQHPAAARGRAVRRARARRARR